MSAPRSRLVGAREPRELAEVGVAPAPVPAGEHGKVVVVLDEDLLAELLERQPAGRGDETFVALQKRAQQAPSSLGELWRQLLLERGEERPAHGVPPNQQQCVVRDPDERRCEHGRERLVVVAVLESRRYESRSTTCCWPK